MADETRTTATLTVAEIRAQIADAIAQGRIRLVVTVEDPAAPDPLPLAVEVVALRAEVAQWQRTVARYFDSLQRAADERDDLRLIVRDLAAADPVATWRNEMAEDDGCALCRAYRGREGGEIAHTPTCPWLRARARRALEGKPDGR